MDGRRPGAGHVPVPSRTTEAVPHAHRCQPKGTSGDELRRKPTTLAAFNKTRDVVIVNQRGVGSSPDPLKLPRQWQGEGGKTSLPLSIEEASARIRAGLGETLEACKSQGIDAAGYDIINLIHDVDDLRKALGYEKIALRGTSFGSQRALVYMKRWPERVDRAILAGLEPLDCGYDSAQGVWRVFERLDEQLAKAGNEDVANTGVCARIRTIVERLKKDSVRYQGQHPRTWRKGFVAIGLEDFREYLRRPVP